LKIEDLVLEARSEFNGFADTAASSFGVLEYWSVGKSESPNFIEIDLFITPLLHHSSTPAVCIMLCGEWRGNGPELLLIILSGLSEVLRDSIKTYVFWSSWWV
jgi:hypothetical protein